ncbi:hypothetical protein Nepgr_002849 [Nepenthes gracilis]|uniref:F-actin-capping protein subunit beta n=1 Tax=Nepenthes gracilis TaxID=150966 RepID=A0AAD3RYL1_NEPGR|nr:hypothetical protein Nepgr_002849 [Nepenthes gracilis]
MEAAMGLMRRMHPKHVDTVLSALLSLMPEHFSDLLSQVDQPLQVLCDIDSGKEFILCEYNRDADSYRSPWSNKYHPQLEEGLYPSLELRKLEIEANDVFAVYRDQYYEGGISSVYMYEDDNEGFVACFLIKKDGSKSGQGRRGYLHEGEWDAIHVIEVGPEEDGTSHYCLTSTVMLSLTTDNESCGTFSLSGSIRRQMNMDLSVAEGHLCNMGRMIEEMESKLRYSLDQVYFGKTREMVCTLRPPAELAQQHELAVGPHNSTVYYEVEQFEACDALLCMLLEHQSLHTPHHRSTHNHHAILCATTRVLTVLLRWEADVNSSIATACKVVFHLVHVVARLNPSPLLDHLSNIDCDINPTTAIGNLALMSCANCKRNERLGILTVDSADFGLGNKANPLVDSIARINRWSLNFQQAVLYVLQV